MEGRDFPCPSFQSLSFHSDGRATALQHGARPHATGNKTGTKDILEDRKSVLKVDESRAEWTGRAYMIMKESAASLRSLRASRVYVLYRKIHRTMHRTYCESVRARYGCVLASPCDPK